jgi:hypothetical protein
MDLAEYLAIVPVAMTISYLSFLPLGVGVGQIAFYELFSWFGRATPQQGATLCTALQGYLLLFSLIGALTYVGFRRREGAASCA